MKTNMAFKLALKNIDANKVLQIPFIISTSVMTALLFVMASLLNNDYVNSRHETLPTIILFGTFLVVILSTVFAVYANRFMMKRRNKEFALYGILGLEKKHISKIILIEQLILFFMISILSIVGGFLLGKLSFVFLNRILQGNSVSLMAYPFSMTALAITEGFLLAIFILLHIGNVLKINTTSPVELMSKQYKGEGEPKTRWLLGLFGLVSLGVGYYLALAIKGTLNSIGMFFVAALLVIIGTYLLFVSLTIIVLKILKSKKSYYKPKNFLSVSGMLYRMKSNGIALASIAVLSTAVIITLSTTLTIFGNMEKVIDTTMPKSYSIENTKSYDLTSDVAEIKVAKDNMQTIVKSSVAGDEEIENFGIEQSISVPSVKEKNKLSMLKAPKGGVLAPAIYYLLVTDLDSYNIENGMDIKLADNEILVTSNNKEAAKDKTLILADKEYKTKTLDEQIAGNVAVEAYKIVVPNYEDLIKIADYYKETSSESGEYMTAKLDLSADWNIKNTSPDYKDRLAKAIEKAESEGDSVYEYKAREDFGKAIYEMNGGFLFLGIIIGIVFLGGTILITYYKQVSEGYEDRGQFAIMKKVGLPDELIRKTASSQIIWMFLLPLVVASVHTLVASKIIFQLLAMFGVREFTEFLIPMGTVIGIFAIVYLIVFYITSRIYYRIVK